MPTTIRMLVELVNANGVPADSITNTWHARSHSIDPADDAEAFFEGLSDFYGTIDGIFSTSISGVLNFKCYDLEQPTPRVPIFTDSGTITPSTNALLPNEVACVLSYSAPSEPGISPSSKRGRIYLGPLDSSVLDDGTGDARITTGVTTLIGGAANDLVNEGGILSFQWAVFSPTLAAGSITPTAIDNATAIVTNGFVDNAFDIVRSRGTAASVRSLWTS